MRKIILVSLIILLFLGLAACTPVVQTVTSTESQAQIAELTGQLNELQNGYDTLQNKYQTDLAATQGQIDDLNNTMAALQADYDTLQQNYNNLLTGQTGLRNPTWTEIKTFIAQDTTDTIPYDLETFVCSGYAITVRDHARNLGVRTAYIQIEYGLAGSRGHALNAFETTDKGLVYIDCTESDKVAYVKVGQPYGTTDIEAVKSEYIACDGSPTDFWHPLSYKTVANPFGYDYYLDYQSRRDFCSKTIDAYNAAVSQYNNGTGQWTIAQLDTWRSNIEVLKQDLGTWYMPSDVVSNILTYWGDN